MIKNGRWLCENCGQRFDRDKSGPRPIRFCSADCYQGWRRRTGQKAGCFERGQKPWNAGIKGLHLSPQTEFKSGQIAFNKMSVGDDTIRIDKNGRLRWWVKIAEPNVWRERAIVVWERHSKTTLPAGCVVHHRDRNSTNDDPENLQLMTRAEHIEEHRADLLAAKSR